MSWPAPCASECMKAMWLHAGKRISCLSGQLVQLLQSPQCPRPLPRIAGTAPYAHPTHTLRTPWPPTVLQTAAPHPSPSPASITAPHNLFYLKCRHCLLHTMQLWHVGSTEAMKRIYVHFPDRNAPAPFLLEMIFGVLVAWAEAQLKLKVVQAFQSSVCVAETMPQCHTVTLWGLKPWLMVNTQSKVHYLIFWRDGCELFYINH